MRRGTTVSDRSSDRFSVPVMGLPLSPRADGGPVRIRQLGERGVEIADGVGRTRVLHYVGGKIARMETTIAGSDGLYERVDQRREGAEFVSAFVEPGRAPRVAHWFGEVLVRVDRGLVNYVTLTRERLYETADGRVVQERALRNGARIFSWFDRDGRVRTKQILDAAGRRHFLSYDQLGLAKIRLADGTELTRGAFGLWETASKPLRKLELFEDGSVRWLVERTLFEVRGDGTSAFRTEHGGNTEFVRRERDGRVGCCIQISRDATGAEKMIVR